jgi:hypothetical protein
MIPNEEAFEEFVESLKNANPELSEADAGEAAAEIGDTPNVNDEGKAIVPMPDGRVLLLNLPEEGAL